jgi:spermidine synthase
VLALALGYGMPTLSLAQGAVPVQIAPGDAAGRLRATDIEVRLLVVADQESAMSAPAAARVSAVEVRLGDARAFIGQTEERFDQIVLDLTDPFGPAVELYTVEFYAACRRALNPGGVLSLHLGSPVHLPESLGM